jgi:hypothetical protein
MKYPIRGHAEQKFASSQRRAVTSRASRILVPSSVVRKQDAAMWGQICVAQFSKGARTCRRSPLASPCGAGRDLLPGLTAAGSLAVSLPVLLSKMNCSHLIGAECGRIDEFVAAVGQDRMRIAASGDYLNRFRLRQPIFADRELRAHARPPGTEFLDAETGRQNRH